MTVNLETPSIVIHGNGTKTGYTFSFSWTDLSDIKVFYTPIGYEERQLGPNDFSLTVNPGVGGILEFITITPATQDLIRISRMTPVNQNIDYQNKQKVDYNDVQYSLDKLTRILAETSDILGNIPDTLLPDPTLSRKGQIVISDGQNKFAFFPYAMDTPQDSQDGYTLILDKETKTIKYIPSTGATNPAIPQNQPTHKYLENKANAYVLGPEHPDFLSTDVGYAETWDGTKFIKSQAKGINNPPIASPTKIKTVLTSKSDGSGGLTTEWVDDTYKAIETSSGVIKPCAIVKATDTTINITAGVLQIVQDTTDAPTVDIIVYAGTTGVAIPTTVGQSHLVYLDFTNSTPAVVVQTAYERLPRGRKVFIGEVEHTYNNIITKVTNTPTIVSSLASQLRQLFVDIIGNIARGVNLTGVNPNTLVLSAGTFIGWGVNFAADALRPHNATLAAKNPALFRWRDALGRDSAEANSIDTANLQTDNGSGVLTPVGANRWVQVLVWIYPDSSLIIQYPRISYTAINNIPSLSVFLDTVQKNPAALRNAAPIAVLNLQAGGTFSVHQIFLLTGFFGSGSTASDVTVPGNPPQFRLLYGAPGGGVWAISPYTLQTPVSGTDDGKSVLAQGGNFVIGNPSDITSRTWLSNGILDGFGYTFSGQQITINAGHALFCINDTPGSPTNVFVLNYAGSTYTVPTIATQEVSYIYIDNIGALTSTNVESKLVRGNKLLLFRVEHGGNTVIEGMQAVYYALNAIPEQVKEIFEVYGNSIKNFQVASSSTNVITHNGGIYFGYAVGANTNALTPHRVALAASNPLNFKFVQTNGTESANQTSFPAVPKVELTANTLTDLGTGQVAYYPIWIFPSGRTLVQYATQTYTAGSEPEAATIWLTFPRDATLQAAAFLAGFVKWAIGKDFTNGNSLVNIGVAGSGSSGGGVPVIPTTPGDKYKLYQVQEGGSPGLGPYLPRPKDDGSDLDSFAGHGLEWSMGGGTLETRKDVIPEFADFTSSIGDHLLSIQGNIVTPLTNKSDYVDPSLWTVIDIAFFNTFPAPIVLAKKGFLISKMTRNDEGGGLTISTSLRLSDVFTGIDFSNFNGNLNAYNSTPTAGPSFNAVTDWSPFFPTQGSNAAFLPAANKMLVYNGTDSKATYAYEFVSDHQVRLSPCLNSVYDKYTIQNTETHNIDLSMINTNPNLRYGFYKDTAGVQYSYWVGLKCACIFDLTGKTNISISIEIVDFKFKIMQFGTNPYVQDFGLKLWTSSSTAITADTYKHITSYGTADTNGVYTIPIGLKTTVKSSDTVIYHQNASDVGPQTDDKFYFGFEVLPTVINTSPQVSLINPISSTILLNIESSVPVGDQIRYELGSLSTVNTLPAEAGKVWDGTMPALAPGKILIVYYILYPKVPASATDFDMNLSGIMLHPFIPQNVPAIFLENQTGTTKYTDRIEAKRRKTRSTLLEVYELDCTADQFTNWKLAIYFRSKLADAAFKQNTDKLGASLWFANESDIPL